LALSGLCDPIGSTDVDAKDPTLGGAESHLVGGGIPFLLELSPDSRATATRANRANSAGKANTCFYDKE
jgi:hypothetical protein